MKIALLLVLASSFLFSDFTYGKKRKRKRRSQVAIVQVDGAAVYKVANFDSPIIAYLNKGRKIRASKKNYPGIGGLGSFYKVRLKKGKYGYVTDVDLFPTKRSRGSGQSAANDIFTPQGGDQNTVPAMNPSGNKPIYMKRYLGVSYNMVNYTEEVINKPFTESLGFFGLKVSGPGALFTNLPLELNVMAFLGAPDYYNITYNEPDGYIIIADVLYMLPLMSKPNYMLYLAVGPAVKYSSFRVKVRKLSKSNLIRFDLQTVNIGVSGGLGFGMKLGESLALKAEGKYIYEDQGHIVFGGSIQFSY